MGLDGANNFLHHKKRRAPRFPGPVAFAEAGKNLVLSYLVCLEPVLRLISVQIQRAHGNRACEAPHAALAL